jgi:hypothetical protein
MIDYPDPLVPDALEAMVLASGDEVQVPKVRLAFKRWTGKFEGDTYGNKPLVPEAIFNWAVVIVAAVAALLVYLE